MEKTIGFSIEVKGTDSEIQQLQSMKGELSNLEKQFAKYTNTSSVHAVALSTKIKALKTDINAQEKAIISNANSLKLTANSVNALVAENKRLSAILKDMPIGTATEEYKQMQKTIVENGQKIAEFNEGIGKVSLPKTLKQELKDLKSQLATMDKGAEFDALTKKAGELADRIKDSNEAVKAFTTGSKAETTRTLFGQIVDDVKNLDFAGAAEKARTLAAVVQSMTFAEAIKGVKDFGSTIINLGRSLLANPLFILASTIAAVGYAVYDLVNIMGQASQQTDTLTDSIKRQEQAVKSYSDKIFEANLKIKESLGLITKQEAEVLKTQRELDGEKLKLKNQYYEELKTLAEELELDLTDMEEGMFSESYKLNYADLENRKKFNAEKRILDVKYAEEAAYAVAQGEAEIKAIKAKAAAEEKERKRKEAEEAKKEQDRINKQRLEDNKNLIRQIEEQEADLIFDETARLIRKEEIRHKYAVKDIEASTAFGKTKAKAIEVEAKQFNANLEKIYADAYLKQSEANEKSINESKKAFSERAKLISQQAKDEAAARQVKYEKEEEEEKAHREKINQLIRDGAIGLAADLESLYLENQRAKNQREQEFEIKQLEDRRETEQILLEEKLRDGLITEAQFKTEKAAQDKKFQEEELQLKRKAFEQEKKLKRQQIGIELALELARIAANAAANPANAVTVGGAGLAQYAVQSGIAIARAGIQYAAVDAAQFAKGGMINGESHSNGGVPFTVNGRAGFEAEGGEAIINKQSMANPMLRALASAINVAGGGVAFERGGLLPTPAINSGGSNPLQTLNFGNFAKQIIDGINDKKVIQVESDVRGVLNRVSQIESDSSF